MTKTSAAIIVAAACVFMNHVVAPTVLGIHIPSSGTADTLFGVLVCWLVFPSGGAA